MNKIEPYVIVFFFFFVVNDLFFFCWLVGCLLLKFQTDETESRRKKGDRMISEFRVQLVATRCSWSINESNYNKSSREASLLIY